MLITLLTPLVLAQAALGVDWVPSSRADLVWVSEDQSSGTLVGELDGLLRPPLQPYAGFTREKNSFFFGLSAARLSTTAYDLEDYSRSSAGAIRPSFDYQRWLRLSGPQQAGLWVGGGVYGTIPLAAYRSSTATEEEQADLKESARSLRSRIGGFGLRASVGGQTDLTPALSLGLRASLVGFRGQKLSEEALYSSTLIYPEVGLRLQLNF